LANSSRVRFSGEVFHTGGTRRLSSPEFENASAPNFSGVVQQVVLSNGFNTITVPTGARGCLIEFNPGSTVTKTLKGVTGDTGILLDPIGWNVMRFGSSPPASFGITTSGADTGNTTYITFF
jgi:hypothetical protein